MSTLVFAGFAPNRNPATPLGSADFWQNGRILRPGVDFGRQKGRFAPNRNPATPLGSADF